MENEREQIENLRNKRIFLSKTAGRQGCKGKEYTICDLFFPLPWITKVIWVATSNFSSAQNLQLKSKKDFTKHTAPYSPAELLAVNPLRTRAQLQLLLPCMWDIRQETQKTSLSSTITDPLNDLYRALSGICAPGQYVACNGSPITDPPCAILWRHHQL